MASVRITSINFVAAMVVTAVSIFVPLIRAQNARPSGATQSAAKSQASKNQAAPDHIYPEPVDYWKQAAKVPDKGWKRTGGPAPRHDISGVWDPGEVGIQIFGAA